MVFSSTVFLCLFLPTVLGAYYICPKQGRNLLLLIASLVFYAWGEPKYVLLMLLSIAANYLFGILIEKFKNDESKKKLTLIISIVFDIGLLCVFKYTDFAIENINRAFGAGLDLVYLALPIGISFYTFQAMSYTIDVYRGKTEAQRNIISFGMYICLFPQLIAGPIVRYTDIAAEIDDRRIDLQGFTDGLFRFTVGLGKKVLLANQIGVLWDEALAFGGHSSALMAWLGAIAYAFRIYFDFSGYSDMAIGLGRMLGFSFPENFRYPYESRSITEFWRRWHITLGTWFREYLYIPLGGNRRGLPRQALNLLIVWALTGLWHGAGWNFVLWGLYFFVILLAEKLFLLKWLDKLPKFAGHIYALLLIVLGWVVFACDDVSMLLPYLGSMFGANGFASGQDLYYLASRGALLVILAVGSTQLPKIAFNKLQLNEKAGFSLKAALCLCVLVLSVTLLISDSYNPFLYFRF